MGVVSGWDISFDSSRENGQGRNRCTWLWGSSPMDGGRSWGFGFSPLPLHHQPTGAACQGGEEANQGGGRFAVKLPWKSYYTWFCVSSMRHGERAGSGGLRKSTWKAIMLTRHNRWYTMSSAYSISKASKKYFTVSFTPSKSFFPCVAPTAMKAPFRGMGDSMRLRRT